MGELFRMQENFERRIIMETLQRCNWNQADTAEQFHLPLTIFERKMKRLKIEAQGKGEDF